VGEDEGIVGGGCEEGGSQITHWRARRVWQIVQLSYEFILLLFVLWCFPIAFQKSLQTLNQVVVARFWPDTLIMGGEEPALAEVLQEQGGPA